MRHPPIAGLIVTVLAALALAAPGCGRQDGPTAAGGLQGRLIITGSSTVAPLAGEIARRFEQSHPGVRIDVQTGGSSQGIADARRGTADIGMASRALRQDDGDVVAHAIALDGISLIAHRDNPVSSLTDEQIINIFTGETTHWSELGGPEQPITVVNKADGRATLELFLNHFNLKAGDIQADVVIGDNQHGIRTVVSDPNAIGYVSIGTAIYEAGRGVAIKTLPMGGVEASLANVRNGSFPLSRPLNLVTHGPLSPLAEAFIAFARSDAVHDLVEAQYFVPVQE